MIENQKFESLFLRQRTLLYILGIICVFYCLERAIIPDTLLFSTIVGTTAGLIPSVIAATVIRFSFDSTDKENLSLKIENLLIKKNFVKCSISNNETRFKRNTHFLLDWHPEGILLIKNGEKFTLNGPAMLIFNITNKI